MKQRKQHVIEFHLHEQTQSNRVCCFQTLDAVFPKDLLSDYSNTNASSFVSISTSTMQSGDLGHLRINLVVNAVEFQFIV